MPTVLRIGGYTFRIYPSDHEPAHVHVCKAGTEAIIQMGESECLIMIRQNRGMTQRDLRQIVKLAEAHWSELRDRWNGIHGKA